MKVHIHRGTSAEVVKMWCRGGAAEVVHGAEVAPRWLVQRWCKNRGGGAKVVQKCTCGAEVVQSLAEVVQNRCRGGAEVQVQSRCRVGAEQVQRWCRAGAEVVQSRCRSIAEGGAEVEQRWCKGAKWMQSKC